VRKTEEGKVLAWQALCPHAGCVLGVKTVEKSEIFACPCHTAHFDLNGKLLDENSSDSPRNMDSLETKIEDGKVYVKFQNFQFGVSATIPA